MDSFRIMIDACSQVSLDVLVKLGTLIVSILNLGFVFYFFYANRRMNIELTRQNKRSTWFRQIIFEPHHDDLNDFYKNVLQIVNNGETSVRNFIAGNNGHASVLNETKQTMERVNNCIFEFQNHFVDIVRAFDKELGQKLVNQVDDLQDELSLGLNQLVLQGAACQTKFPEIVRKSRTRFVEDLFSYDLE